MSQVISSNTVSNMLTVTKRTPASIMRRASRQLCPNRFMPYFWRTLFRLARELERLARLLRRHQRVGLVEGGVEQPRVLRGLEPADGLVHHLAPVAPAVDAQRGKIIRRQHVRHFEIRIGRVGIQHERIERAAEKAGVLAVRHVAAGVADRARQQHVRRHIAVRAL